jgi:iron-sulfur cluster repair protein YtfE (RIC family)
MTTNVTITPQMQVNQIIQLFPATLPVFHAAGVDSCCGGALPLEEVARRHNFDGEQLLAELRRAAGEGAAQG